MFGMRLITTTISLLRGSPRLIDQPYYPTQESISSSTEEGV